MTHVHFIGIGGSGLSAIARLLKETGYEVTGSDQSLSSFAADLQSIGVQIVEMDGESVTTWEHWLRKAAEAQKNLSKSE